MLESTLRKVHSFIAPCLEVGDVGKIREFRIKGDPEETGIIGRRDKRASDFTLGAGENGIIIIEMNANSFFFRKPEAVDVSPVAQNF